MKDDEDFKRRQMEEEEGWRPATRSENIKIFGMVVLSWLVIACIIYSI